MENLRTVVAKGNISMKSATKQREFIRLKAEGKSNAQIARLLHISESTASRYTKLLGDKIANYKAEQLQELYDAYYMTRAARIRRLGETLNQVDQAISTSDLSLVPTEKLLDLKLKYAQALKNEHISLEAAVIDGDKTLEGSAKDILGQMNCLLHRLRIGSITPDNAKMEAKILDALLKGWELVALEDRIRQLEQALKDKGRNI